MSILIELLQVQMTLSNPLNISLCIENLSLTFSFDKGLSLVEPQVLDELLLAPSSTTQVIFQFVILVKDFFNAYKPFYMTLGYSWSESKK